MGDCPYRASLSSLYCADQASNGRRKDDRMVVEDRPEKEVAEKWLTVPGFPAFRTAVFGDN